jgi:hypothetical protein
LWSPQKEKGGEEGRESEDKALTLVGKCVVGDAVLITIVGALVGLWLAAGAVVLVALSLMIDVSVSLASCIVGAVVSVVFSLSVGASVSLSLCDEGAVVTLTVTLEVGVLVSLPLEVDGPTVGTAVLSVVWAAPFPAVGAAVLTR